MILNWSVDIEVTSNGKKIFDYLNEVSKEYIFECLTIISQKVILWNNYNNLLSRLSIL